MAFQGSASPRFLRATPWMYAPHNPYQQRTTILPYGIAGTSEGQEKTR
jgi:hypothetical protein